MKKLGYKKANNPMDINREDSFLPIGYDGFLPPYSNHDKNGFYCMGWNDGISHAKSFFEDTEIAARSSGEKLIFVWKEDSSGVEYVQAYFDGTDMIDIDSFYEVIVRKVK